jgi:hypothetical protein
MLDMMLSPADNTSMTTASSHQNTARGIAEEVRIRVAYPDDLTVLERLAALDSQEPLEGDVLIAELAGVAVAALSVSSGRVVADPFVHTETVVHLLRVRASRATPGRRARHLLRRRLLRRPRPATRRRIASDDQPGLAVGSRAAAPLGER